MLYNKYGFSWRNIYIQNEIEIFNSLSLYKRNWYKWGKEYW